MMLILCIKIFGVDVDNHDFAFSDEVLLKNLTQLARPDE